MAFNKNIGGHAFPERGGTCLRCGMTWAKFTDSEQPQCTGRKPESRDAMPIDEDEKIYADPVQPATLRHAGGSVDCLTLGEAVIAWGNLPEAERKQATIKVNVPSGAIYNADEIDRLYIARKTK